jgi:hypothetical protein
MFKFTPHNSNANALGIIHAKVEWEPCDIPRTNLLFLTNRGGDAQPIETFYLNAFTGDVYRVTHARPYAEFAGTWMRVVRSV